LNAQLDEENTEPIWHANEIISTRHKWQFVTHGYYIPKAIVPSWSSLVARYYTHEPIHVLNPIVAYSKLEHNLLLNQLEQLHNLEQRPSHLSNYQQHVKSMEVVVASIAIQQTQPFHQII
jgi:hypothetical protein